ncbi:hypothetical protein N9Y42_09270 [Mariniblastus sp.]|nr:hypothetical protein [Mariniblastus sp.]
MPSQYSLPCPKCQHQNAITSTQAGQDLECAGCQNTIQVPRLGELKQLPAIESSQKSSVKRSSRGGKLFVLGMIMLIFGGGGGAGLFYYATSKLFDYNTKLEEAVAEMDPLIKEANLLDLTIFYETMPLEKGLPAWQEPPYVSSHKQGIILRYISYGLLTIGGIGLLFAITGFFK